MTTSLTPQNTPRPEGLTPGGQRLADALVKAGGMTKTPMHPSFVSALNTTAEILLTPAEGAGLREVATDLVAFWDRIGNGQHEKLDNLVRKAKAALSPKTSVPGNDAGMRDPKCPIGLDATPGICSAGTCYVCASERAALSPPTGSAGDDETGVREDSEHVRDLELQETADGAWGGGLAPGRAREMLDRRAALAPLPPKAETPAGEPENRYVTSLYTYAEICDRYELHVEASGMRDTAKRMLHLEAEIAALSLAPAARAGDGVDADNERLDWLEQAARKSRSGISFDHIPSVEGERSGFRFMRKFFIGDTRDTLRSAIDAACGEVEQMQRGEARAALTAAPAANGEDA